MHQPFRLHPEGTALFWDEKNREIFVQRAERCYLPTIQMFSDLVRDHYDFKISLSISGTFLEQAELYQPQVLDALKGLLHLGGDTRQVEFLEQPYYYSYASFFADPRKTEFQEQVSLHRQKMHDIFGVKPTAFANTGLSYNNEIANIVADMGFKAILCEPTDKTIDVRNRAPIRACEVHRAIGRKGRPRKLAVLPRNTDLSRRLPAGVNGDASPAGQYADLIHEAGGEVMVLFSDFPLVEAGTPAYEKMAGVLEEPGRRRSRAERTSCRPIRPRSPSGSRSRTARWSIAPTRRIRCRRRCRARRARRRPTPSGCSSGISRAWRPRPNAPAATSSAGSAT